MNRGVAGPLTPAEKGSFAYLTVRDRLPITVTKIIDYLHREKDNFATRFGQEASAHIKEVTSRLAKLKNELQTDKLIVPVGGRDPDVRKWNKTLETLPSEGELKSWFSLPWLFVECYFYRRIYEAFQLSEIFRGFDYFQHTKEEGLLSYKTVTELLGNFLVQSTKVIGNTDVENVFLQLLQICLWGNRCDLSIAAGADRAQTENPVTMLNNLYPYILVDDSKEIWKIITEANSRKPSGLHVAFILDNAGFELFGDLCLASFLCDTNIAQQVSFYVKAIPWFVSDTMYNDFYWTINTLKGMDSGGSAASALGEKWQRLVDGRRWIVKNEIYWTLPFDYSDMKKEDSTLYDELRQVDFAFFKGDLNYRKLTGDRMWDTTTPFDIALRGFNPTSFCVLRTVKAELIVGLNPGQAEEISRKQKDWMISGEYAVIQCHKKSA